MNNQNQFLLKIFILALILRLAILLCGVYERGSIISFIAPSDGYQILAENILNGNGFSHEVASPYTPDSTRTPLYPAFIAAVLFVFKSYWAVILIQAIIGSIIPILGFYIALKMTRVDFIAKITTIILAIEPFSATLSVSLATETLFTALLLSAFLLMLRYFDAQQGKSIAIAGFLFGVATLIKPTIQYLPFFIFVFIYMFFVKNKLISKKMALWHCLLLLSFFLIIVAPWAMRNYKMFGKAELSVQAYSNLFAYYIPSILAYEYGTGFEEAKNIFLAGENVQHIGVINLGNADTFKARAFRIIPLHPKGVVLSAFSNIFAFFTNDGYFSVLQKFGFTANLSAGYAGFLSLVVSPTKLIQIIKNISMVPIVVVMAGRIFWTSIFVLFLCGLWFSVVNKIHISYKYFALLFVVYFVFTTNLIGLAVNARFRFPVNTFIIIFALSGAYELHHLWKQQTKEL